MSNLYVSKLKDKAYEVKMEDLKQKKTETSLKKGDTQSTGSGGRP